MGQKLELEMLPSQKYVPGQEYEQNTVYTPAQLVETPYQNQDVEFAQRTTPYPNTNDASNMREVDSNILQNSKYQPMYEPGAPINTAGQELYKNVQFSNENYQPNSFEPAPYPPQEITQDQYQENYLAYNEAATIEERYIQQAERSRLYNEPALQGQQQVLLEPDTEPQYYDQMEPYRPEIKATSRPELSSAALNAEAYQLNLANADFEVSQPVRSSQDRFVPQLSVQPRAGEDLLAAEARTFYEFLVFGQAKTESHESVGKLLEERTGVEAEYVRTAPQGYIFQVDELEQLLKIYEKTPFPTGTQQMRLISVTKEPVHVEEVRQQRSCAAAPEVLFFRYVVLAFAVFAVMFSASPMRASPAILHCAISIMVAVLVFLVVLIAWVIGRPRARSGISA